MLQVFVKTMVTCVCLCNIHGLVFLPAILSMVDRLSAKFVRKKTYSTPAERAVKKRMIQARKKISRIAEAQENCNDAPDNKKVDRPPLTEFD